MQEMFKKEGSDELVPAVTIILDGISLTPFQNRMAIKAIQKLFQKFFSKG